MVYFPGEGLPFQKQDACLKIGPGLHSKSRPIRCSSNPSSKNSPPSLPGDIFSLHHTLLFFQHIAGWKEYCRQRLEGWGVFFFINMWKMWVLLKWFFFTPLWYLKIIFGIHPKSFQDNSCRSQHDCDIQFIKIQSKTNLRNGLGKYLLPRLSLLSIKDFISLKLFFIFISENAEVLGSF